MDHDVRSLLDAKIERRPGSECWHWTGHLVEGYGRIKLPGRSREYAHRVSYEEYVGPIPAGLYIDHLCRDRTCVRPDHLEPVTQRVNILRGTSFMAANARKTTCVRGHDFSPENTILRGNGRRCRTCLNEDQRAHRARQKARA